MSSSLFSDAISNGAVILVIIYILIKTGKYLWFFFKLYCRPQKNLYKRYVPKENSDTYALVLAATETIGKDFAKQLAAKNFNLILASNNEKELAQFEDEIKKNYPKIKSKAIVFDFFNNDNNTDYFQDFFKQLDVGVFVNIAGIECSAKFLDIDIKKYKELINLNCFVPLTLTYYMLKKMEKRMQQSCVINISHGVGILYPTGYFAAHSATKAFTNQFTRSLREEYPKIDFLSLAPLSIDKSNRINYEILFGHVEPVKTVKGACDMLGYDNFTNGSAKHIIYYNIMKKFPESVYRKLSYKYIGKKLAKEKKGEPEEEFQLIVVDNNEKSEKKNNEKDYKLNDKLNDGNLVNLEDKVVEDVNKIENFGGKVIEDILGDGNIAEKEKKIEDDLNLIANNEEKNEKENQPEMKNVNESVIDENQFNEPKENDVVLNENN